MRSNIFDDVDWDDPHAPPEPEPDPPSRRRGPRSRRRLPWLLFLVLIALGVCGAVWAAFQLGRQSGSPAVWTGGIPPYVDQAYTFWDRDGDGLLDTQEMRAALDTVDPQAPKQAQGGALSDALGDIMARYDADKNGALSKQEFSAWIETGARINPDVVPPEILTAPPRP